MRNMAKEMDEKMGMCGCGCGMGHGMWGKHLYFLIGILALVYGVIEWARVTYMWPPYMGWVVGGIILIIVGIAKKWFWKMRMGM